MISRNCRMCSSIFHVKPSHVKMGYGKYCSRGCHHKGMMKGAEKQCAICKKRILRTPAKADNSKSGKFFCGKSCQTKWRNTVFVGVKHRNWKGGDSAYRNVLLKTKIPQKCKVCKNSDTRVLAVHHIDHNHRNNQVSNLAWLCHNCHHEVHYGKLRSVILRD